MQHIHASGKKKRKSVLEAWRVRMGRLYLHAKTTWLLIPFGGLTHGITQSTDLTNLAKYCMWRVLYALSEYFREPSGQVNVICIALYHSYSLKGFLSRLARFPCNISLAAFSLFNYNCPHGHELHDWWDMRLLVQSPLVRYWHFSCQDATWVGKAE